MYKIFNTLNGIQCVERSSDNAFTQFDPANVDYQQFKKDVLEGAGLQDADGVAMSAADAEAFIKELP